MPILNLREADSLNITVLVDNYVDMLKQPETGIDKRPSADTESMLTGQHGLSCLIRVRAGEKEHTVLMDTGIEADCLFHNAGILGVDLDEAESVILSHGHFDHTGGLLEDLENSDRALPLFVHPEAFRSRRITMPGGKVLNPSGISRDAVKEAGAAIHGIPGPSATASGLIDLTGEVPRKVPFEKGLPGAEYIDGGKWMPDTIPDDKAIVINYAGKGLVVISGCAHVGIINTVKYAQEITGIKKVYAVIGGFHLSGAYYDPIVQPTISAMQEIGPDYLVPMHCTGWNAINRFREAMPGRCILNTVGTRYTFSGGLEG